MSDGFETRGTIARNEKDEILIKTGEYYNIEVLDIRWHTLSKPTRKGIRLNMEEAKKLLNVLKRVLDE
ncbi:PC4/YdbC family ssDNA-binding protein [bacterium]|jgi:hypothetical protein|nr:PC4/YdbC family ssDNA-binding protein [bacterium]MDB4347890.1 PC4/YdbC family ssDNA-binding protein [bacterium]